MRYWLLFSLFYLPSAMALPDFTADYAVSLKGMSVAKLHQSLITNADDSRTMTATTKTVGLARLIKKDRITETSTWRESDAGIQTLAYRYARTGGKSDRQGAADFDWDNAQIAATYKTDTVNIILPDNEAVFDKLSYQQALIRDLAAESTALSYQVVDKTRLKTYNVLRQATETITTPLGTFKAIKIVRERTEKSDRQTTLWCAPSLQYLPIKLEHIEKDGSKFIATLSKVTGITVDE